MTRRPTRPAALCLLAGGYSVGCSLSAGPPGCAAQIDLIDVGACAAQWPTECSDSCVDTYTDPANCGACGNSCQGGFYTSLVCLDGLVDCYGRCVDLASDWQNCGGCGLGCFSGYTCENSVCV